VKVCPTCSTEYADDQRFCPLDGTALRSTAQGDLLGTVIADRYHIVKKLGEGGMGAVYLGEHVKMGRKSAIKVMAASMTADPDAIARFNREAANAARINHPNVCAIYDFGETADGLIFLAMEFIEGETLGTVIEREGTLPAARAAAILQQAAEALQAAHELGIVHRDLKPDNIMLTRGRGGELVKVVDFGIAKAMRGEENQQVTKTGLVVGTPEYMSPEQLSGDVLDGRSDIYALALVFYRMLTGTFPFPADTAQEMMIKRLTDDPLPLNVARPGSRYPGTLQRVMDRALARMPADRYASAVEFARDAAAAVRGMPRAPGPPVATEATTEVMEAGTVELVPTQVRPSQRTRAPTTPTTPQPAPPPAAAPPKRHLPAAAVAALAVIVIGGGATAGLMLFKGGNGSGAIPPDSQLVARRDSTVTDRTAPPPATGQDTGRAPALPAPDHQAEQRPTPVETSAAHAAPPVDSVAVYRELGELLDRSAEASTRAAALRRALEIYHDAALPVNLRAEGAAIAANGAFEDGDRPRACQLMADARRLMPASRAYHQSLTSWGCGT
jgi:predicted Ser/Thr protein kinase